MFRFFRNAAIAVVTFGLGVGVCGAWGYRVSLEEITENRDFYNGKLVKIESYAQLEDEGQGLWRIGEPFEKREIFAFARMENNSTGVSELANELSQDRSDRQYNRARVLVIGRLRDNCISMTCCFGKSVTIDVQSLTQLAPTERYSRPEPPE